MSDCSVSGDATGAPAGAPDGRLVEGGAVLKSVMRETNGGGALESVPGFAAGWALTQGFRPARLAPSPAWPGQGAGGPPASRRAAEEAAPARDARLEIVHGGDDRVLIRDTSLPPWRSVCQLDILFENGSQGFGTGWFAGPRTVITAGHCLVDPRTGLRAVRVVVTPGRNGTLGPYGFFVSNAFAVLEGWPDLARPDLDLGAIRVESDLDVFKDGVGSRLGYFGLARFPEERLRLILVNIAGYPVEADKPFGSQWYTGGRIEAVEPDFIRYTLDTQAGQSGSPVFYFDRATDQRLVVGVHTTGFHPNGGVRITGRAFEAVRRWIDGPQALGPLPAAAGAGRRRRAPAPA